MKLAILIIFCSFLSSCDPGVEALFWNSKTDTVYVKYNLENMSKYDWTDTLNVQSYLFPNQQPYLREGHFLIYEVKPGDTILFYKGTGGWSMPRIDSTSFYAFKL